MSACVFNSTAVGVSLKSQFTLGCRVRFRRSRLNVTRFSLVIWKWRNVKQTKIWESPHKNVRVTRLYENDFGFEWKECIERGIREGFFITFNEIVERNQKGERNNWHVWHSTFWIKTNESIQFPVFDRRTMKIIDERDISLNETKRVHGDYFCKTNFFLVSCNEGVANVRNKINPFGPGCLDMLNCTAMLFYFYNRFYFGLSKAIDWFV